MKIIYDSDNNFENSENESYGSIESEDVEITFTSEGKPKAVNRPKPNLTPPPKKEEAPAPQQSAPFVQPQGMVMPNPMIVDSNGNPLYGTPMQMTPEQWNMMVAQFAAMQQAAMFMQPQQPMQPMPSAMPGQPYEGFIPYTPAQPIFEANGQNPQTKVLYQSADFDAAEKAPEKPYEYEPPRPVFTEELQIEEEVVPLSRSKTKARFNVDENEMTMFEFDAMAKKMNVPQYKKDEEDEPEKVIPEDTEAEEEEAPKKKLPTAEIVRRVVLAVSLVAIVVSSGMLLNEWRLSKQNDKVMEEMSDLIIDEPQKNPENNKEPEKELTPEEQWAKIRRKYPGVIFPQNMQLKYANLYGENPEFVGYLSADGVNLNLPVVQAKDDKKYLEKNFKLQSTKYGCPFVTHLNNIEPLDRNTVIFGHHMNNGTIFGALDKYKTIDGFRKAPVITFNTLYRDYSWKVIAAIVTNAYTKDDNGYIFRYYFTELSTEGNFASYLNALSERSLYDTGVDVLPTDKLLTLSTCSHEFTDARFVVIARLVRPGESTDVDVTRATVNPNPRYPQAWYDKKGKTNPYKNAFQWEIS